MLLPLFCRCRCFAAAVALAIILDMKQPFTTPAEGTDVFRNFVLPFPGAETRFIHAVEIRPGGGLSPANASPSPTRSPTASQKPPPSSAKPSS